MVDLVAALKEIAHGTKANPVCRDPAAEVARVDKIACEALAAHEAATPDPEDDTLDGVLFRFWIRAASYPGGWPGRLLELMNEHGPKGCENAQPHHYRAALMALAVEKGVNLPG